MKSLALIFALTAPALAQEKGKEAAQAAPSKSLHLLDAELSHWNVWIGVPHKTVKIPGQANKNHTKGKALGLNNDPLQVFSMIEEDAQPVLKVTGQIYGGLTTKKEFENYHLSLQFKWGDQKWEPRLERQRDSGLLLHCVGPHGAFWNVWKRCLECQIQEKDVGDFYALAGTKADIPSIIPKENKKPVYQPGAPIRTVSKSARHGTSKEMPHGEWNTVEIYTIGDQMVHVVNGQINMVLLNTRQNTQYGEAPLSKGQIQIQSEAAEIYYRDIKLTPISEFPAAVKAALK